MADEKVRALAQSEDGLIGGIGRALFGRSWKTTVAGLLTVGCGVVPFVPGLPPAVVEGAKIALPIITGAGLFMSKDSDVTGGRRRNANGVE